MLGWALAFYSLSTLTSMALMNIAAALLLVAYCLHPGKKMKWNHDQKKLAKWSLVLIGCIALSCFSALFYPHHWIEIIPKKEILLGFIKVWYLALPILISLSFFTITREEIDRVLRIYLLGFGILSVLGVFQFFTGFPRWQQIPNQNIQIFHSTLFMGHHLSIASTWIFPVFLILSGLLPKGIDRKLLWIAFGLGVCTLFMTFSRTLWVTLPAGLLLWVVFISKWRVPIIISVLITASLLSNIRFISNRMQVRSEDQGRAEIWKANVDFFKARPILGIGWKLNLEAARRYLPEQYPGRSQYFVGHAHNNILEMLGGVGILGLIAWLIWCLIAAQIFWAIPAMFCAYVVFHLNGITQVNFWDGKVTHSLMFALGLAIYFKQNNKSKI